MIQDCKHQCIGKTGFDKGLKTARYSVRRVPGRTQYQVAIKKMELTREPSLMYSIIAYLKNGELLEEKTNACILRLKATRYVLYDDKLYRRGYSMPLLKCVLHTKVKNIMWEIHEGTCGNHAGGKYSAFKA